MLFVTICFAVGLWYFPLIHINQKLREQELVLEMEIKQQKEENRQLEEFIHRVKTDPKMVESLARERLHFARPDEIVIRFDPPEDK